MTNCKAFECEQKIPFRWAGMDFRANFAGILTAMLEGSMLHNEVTAHPSLWYVENACGFILTNWQIEAVKYPIWNETIFLRTWPTSFKGFVAERSCELLSKGGECFARANTGWVFLDMNRRKMARPTREIMDGYGELGIFAMEKDFRLPDRDGFTEVESRLLTASVRDMDANRHVNSVAYVEWAIDAIAALANEGNPMFTGFDPMKPCKAKISYRKECSLGKAAEVKVFAGISKNAGIRVNVGEADGDRNLMCEMFFEYN